MKITHDNQVIVFPGDWVRHQGQWFQITATGLGDNILLDQGFWVCADAENLEEILSDAEYRAHVETSQG